MADMAAEEQRLQEEQLNGRIQSPADLRLAVASEGVRPVGTPIIEVEGLTRHYGKLEAVKGISFEVYPGEIFGFLGPNGAGKSTTINMLCTLLHPTAGRARIAGYDIVAQRNKVRESIGLIFQDPSLDDRLTADENLRFHATVYGLPAAVSKQRREELLKMVDLYDRRDQLVRTFSGGMKRRLEIARGLLHYPRVLFLDEPTIGLDPQTRMHLWSYILNLRQQKQITMFLTTHYMDEAEYCDRIAIMDHGKIVALDTPGRLKDMVGGDVIRLKTSDNALAAQQIKEHFGVEPRESKGELVFEIAGGEELVPRIVEKVSARIASISVRRPTLDDVFIKLTGREIREEEADVKEQMRGFMRSRSWARR
ncbi:ATP-binding cassette domain-containing protein [Thermogemmatispora sp.]|uniref:ATP-binding cassette domain-containing protein n=1 Tax=Thermogemmatispora sp. TaxID=1968838 RepID=UPI0035E451C5